MATPEWAGERLRWRYLAPVATPADVAALRAELRACSIVGIDLLEANDTLRARVAVLEEALSDLLADTQHAEHDCGDDDCPVRRARAALGTEAGR